MLKIFLFCALLFGAMPVFAQDEALEPMTAGKIYLDRESGNTLLITAAHFEMKNGTCYISIAYTTKETGIKSEMHGEYNAENRGGRVYCTKGFFAKKDKVFPNNMHYFDGVIYYVTHIFSRNRMN